MAGGRWVAAGVGHWTSSRGAAPLGAAGRGAVVSRPLPVGCGGRPAVGALAGRTEARRGLLARAGDRGARAAVGRGQGAPSGRRRDPFPEARGAVGGGTAACGRPGSVGTGWGRGPHAAPRLPGGLRAPSPPYPAAGEHNLPAGLSQLAQPGRERFCGDPGRAHTEKDEGPTRVRRAQGQGCVFLLCSRRGKKHACLA